MTTRPDPRIVAIAHLAENLATKMPQVRAHVRSQIDALGGLKAANYDTQPGGERTISIRLEDGTIDNIPATAVETAAIQRVQLGVHLGDLEADIKGVAMILSRILQDCDRIIGTRHTDTPRCSSQGREGNELPWPGEGLAPEHRGWADDNCTNVPARGPLCDACAKREYRWRQRNNLQPRRDGLFAGDLDDRGAA